MKRLLSMALAGTTMLALLAGCSNDSSSTSTNTNTGSDNTTLSVLMPSHSSYPYNEEWLIWDEATKSTGVELDVTDILSENGEFLEKLTMVMVSGDLPDLIFPSNSSSVKEYGDDGAFINILDHLDKLPNFSAWYEENSDSAIAFKNSDGSLYQFPSTGAQEGNRRAWLYREDVFVENGLEVPTTDEEFYDVLVALKELYPNSYPLAFRDGLQQFSTFAPQWGSYSAVDGTTTTRYCSLTEDGEWVYAPTLDESKEMYEFFNKLYAEGLMIPNFLSIDQAGWEEVMVNGTSFITIDYIGRVDTFTAAGSQIDPEYKMSYMAPFAGGENGSQKLTDGRRGYYGYFICSTTKNLDAALAYCDFWYSEEGIQLASWGPEDVYSEEVDGEYQWKDGLFEDSIELRSVTGLFTNGAYQIFNYDAILDLATDSLVYAFEQAEQYDAMAQPIPSWTSEELRVIETVAVPIYDSYQENISLFLTGQRSFDEWDSWVETIEKMGVDKIIEIHEQAYERLTAN